MAEKLCKQKKKKNKPKELELKTCGCYFCKLHIIYHTFRFDRLSLFDRPIYNGFDKFEFEAHTLFI